MTQDDPFGFEHEVYEIHEGEHTQMSQVNGSNSLKVCTYPDCDEMLVATYANCVECAFVEAGIDNVSVFVYPGTIGSFNGTRRIVSIVGKAIFLPGRLPDPENINRHGYLEVVARANCLMSLLSVHRLSKGIGWADKKDVVKLSRKIYGETTADEIKVYYEIL